MSSLVSVVVPIYNVEPYLRKCVDSILAQTYKNIEVFLIDDESPDNCPAICDEYAKIDQRIHVIHKKNGGVSSARNAGLDAAQGQYVMFTDSDDCIDADMVETMVNAMEQNKADIVTVNLRAVSATGVKKERVMDMVDEVRSFPGVDYPALSNLYGRQISIFPYNSLYRIDLIRKYSLHFEPMQRVHSEDQLFNYCYYAFVRKAVYIARPFYTYQVREVSLSRGKKPNAILDRRFTWVQDLREFLNKNNFPKQPFFFYALRAWSFFADGCLAVNDPQEILKGLALIRQGDNYRFFKKVLRSMLFGKAGRRYIRSQKMDLRSALYFRFMLLLLLLGKDQRPVNTFLV